MTSEAVLLALCRFCQDAAALLLWGASSYLAWLVPRDIGVEVVARLGKWTGATAAAAAVATVVKLPAEVASIGDGWRDSVDPASVVNVLWETGAGQAWAVQTVIAIVLVLVQAAAPGQRTTATALMSGLLLAALCLTGHAVMHEGTYGVVHRANDVVHVLCAGAWFGALLPVLVILRLSAGSEWRTSASSALKAFSRAGHVVVALVLASGTFNTALVLGRWPIDLSSPYQALLDAKILAVVGMVGLALVNRYLLVPRLSRRPGSLKALRRTTMAEVPLCLAAVALVAVFGMLDPT